MKKVSVLITTYNHEAYIARCLEGVLQQKTNFEFEILVGEDGSQDKTRKICQKFAKKHPDKIRLFLNDRKNVIYIDGKPTGRRNFVNLLKQAQGQYLARCDGDDYWTDPHKLQKMVDFLENNPEYAVAFHRVQWLKNNELQNEPYLPPAGRDSFTVEDLFRYDNFIRTSSVVYRNVLHGQLPEWIFSIPYGDITFHILHAAHGKIKYFDQEMAVYRVHEGGIYSAEAPYLNLFKALMTYRLLARHLGYEQHSAFKAGQARLLRTIAQLTAKAADELENNQIDNHSDSEPLVSVIVPTYNRPFGLEMALESLAHQTFKNFEVIVVNDAGQDVQEVLDRFKEQLTIRYLVHSTNKDLAAARNSGLKAARGKYIAYLDDDDIFFPNHLQETVHVLETTDFAVVYSDAFRFHQVEKDGWYVVKHMDVPYSHSFDPDQLLLHNLFPVLTVVHRKDCVQKTGGFDEQLHTHEDWDFFIRLSRHFQFYHLKKITCAFAARYDASTMTSARHQSFWETTKIIYQKYAQYVQGKPQLQQFQQSHLQNLQNAVKQASKPGASQSFELRGPLVSIVIPLYNQVAYTQKCITALFRNTIYALFEIILVNNASTDGTTELINTLAERYSMIKVIHNQTNLGFARACNQGAQAASGAFVVFLNNDTEVKPFWLVKMFEIMYNDPQVGAVGAKLLYPDGTVQHAGVLITRDEKNGNLLAPWHIYLGRKGDDPQVNMPYYYQALTGACLMVRKNEFLELGGFDEQYINGYEDVDFCFKLGQKGKKLVYQPFAEVVHYESKSGPERFAHMEANKKILHQKWLALVQPDNVVTKEGKNRFIEPLKIGPYPYQQSFLPRPVKTHTSAKRPKIGYLTLDKVENACPVLRLEWPLRYLHQQGIVEFKPIPAIEQGAAELPLEQLRGLDVLIVQRNFAGVLPIQRLKEVLGAQCPKIVYELDDALDRLPEYHPGFHYYQQMRKNIEDYLKHADLVTVASEVLKDYYAPLNANIALLPNTLIEEVWKNKTAPKQRNKRKTRLLFSGTRSHLPDFQLIEDVLERILKENPQTVELLFWADIPTKLEKLPNFKRVAEFMPNYYAYAQKLQSLQADIALVPLVKNDFNLAKTHIKWLEYSACGMAGIYPKIPAYQAVVKDGENGLLADFDAQSWYKAIQFLLKNKKHRNALAKKAHQEVWQQHRLQNQIEKWASAYQHLLETGKENLPDSIAKVGNEPLVSIIIPLYNRLSFTQKCVESLFANTPPVRFEVIFVDNGSTDGTPAYLQNLQQAHSNVRVILNKENVGFAQANNQGAQIAQGKYLLFLNNDTEVQPGWLDALLEIAENDPRVGAVGSKLLFPDGTIQHAGVVIVNDKMHGDPLLATHNFYKEPADKPEANRAMTYQALTAACLLVRKNLFDELQGFDTQFWNGYEDVDLCFRIAQQNYLLVYQPKSVVYHFESQSGPERWTKVKENIQRLHQKWLGKIKPDLVVEKNGKKKADFSHIRPYNVPTSSQTEPRVSIVMLTYNALDYTKKAVDSILQHTNLPYEFILVDNGSKDGTVAYLKKLQKEQKHVKVIFNKKNKGFAAGNNQGAQQAQGQYLLFLNNDVLVADGWLEDLLKAIEKDANIGMVGPLTNSISGLQRIAQVPYTDEDGFYRFAAQVRTLNKDKITPRRRIAGFCLLMPRQLFFDLNGFDESFGTGNFEDDDLCIRTRQKGLAIMVHEGVFIHHYGSQTFKANNIPYNQSLKNKAKIFFKKHPNVDYEELLELKNPLSEVHSRLQEEMNNALAKNDLNQAGNIARQLVRDNPLNDEAWYIVALTAYLTQDYSNSLEALQHILNHDQQNPAALNLKGQVLQAQGQLAEAKHYFEQALKVKPDYLEAQRNLAHCYIESGAFNEGITVLQQILQNAPNDVPTLLYFANLYLEAEKPQEARPFIQQVLQIDPENALAQKMLALTAQTPEDQNDWSEKVNRALQALEQGQAEQAKNALAEIIKAQPQNIEAQYGYALALQMLDDLPAAQEQLNKVLELNPDFTLALNDLARLEILNGQFDKAREFFEKSLNIDPDQVNVKNQLSEVLFALEDFEQGVQLLIETARQHPDDLPTLKHLAAVYQEAGNGQMARKLWAKVLRLNPQDKEANAAFQEIVN